MTLISLLIVLMLEHYFRASAVLEKKLQSHLWFPNWLKWISNKFTQSWFADWGGIVVILGVPLLVVSILFNLDNSYLFWIFQLALSVMVMIYCLGPIDQNAHLKEYFEAAERGDFQSAYHHVEDYLNLKNEHQIPDDLASLGRTVTRLILSQSNFRYFAVLMYFILLGPVGALLYRLTGTFEFKVRDDDSSPYQEKLLKIRTILDWLPSRLTGFLYSLAGDFNGAMSKLKQYLLTDEPQNKILLEETGLGALGIHSGEVSNIVEENIQALDLVKRSVVVLLVFTAVLTVFGWLA